MTTMNFVENVLFDGGDCEGVMPEYRLGNIREVCKKVGLCKSTIYALINKGRFPPPVKLRFLGSSSRWLMTEVNDWIARMVRERDADALNDTSRANKPGSQPKNSGSEA